MIKKILSEKKFGKKIILCHGVFDILHTGHVKYFKQAKNYADILVVSVTSDKFVNKGPLRPINNLSERIFFLKNIVDIDYVIESNNSTSVNIINKIKPHFYCKGPDYKTLKKKDKNLIQEIKAVKKNSGKFITVNHVTRSSTKIIEKLNLLKNPNNEDVINHLEKLKKKYTSDEVLSIIGNLNKKKILVLGELIIDKYIFVEAVGKSGKDPMLVFRNLNSERYLGGTGYIANLCSTLSKTKFISHIGEIDSQEKFIKSNLNKKIKYNFLKKKKSPTISKLRYLDHYKRNKIVGFYNIDDRPLDKNEENNFIKLLKKNLRDTDLIILADYGHGEITSKVRNELQKYNDKLFINTQINSFNSGHQTFKNYKKFNTLCINESEFRNDMKDKTSDISNLYKILKKEIKFNNLIVTKGRRGSTLINDTGIYNCPALEKNPIDTMGSGDTFFTLASLLLNLNANPDLVLFIASLGSSFSTRNMGHKKYYNYNNLSLDIKTCF
jgi:rfaE bifunctional protein kinase chain/domain/rfaE bifunctional protein nucleotidyltransferase chain/domain